MDAELNKYECEIRGVYQAAIAADPDANFYVFSDHGMTPVTKTFDLMGLIQKLGLSVPEDYIALYDATMARFWFFNDRARECITNRAEPA